MWAVVAILLLFCCILLLVVGVAGYASDAEFIVLWRVFIYLLVLVLLVWFCMLFVLFSMFTCYVWGGCLVHYGLVFSGCGFCGLDCVVALLVNSVDDFVSLVVLVL